MTKEEYRADPHSIPDDLLDIGDNDLDQEQLMSRISHQVEVRRREMGEVFTRFPSYGGVPYPGTPQHPGYDPDLYHNLKLVNRLYLEVETEPDLQPSPATRIPIVGGLWNMIRVQAHGLVLFYVNRMIRQEVQVNMRMVSVLNSLSIANEQLLQEIKDLYQEVEELRSKRAA